VQENIFSKYLTGNETKLHPIFLLFIDAAVCAARLALA
jgi:hypothetical protein